METLGINSGASMVVGLTFSFIYLLLLSQVFLHITFPELPKAILAGHSEVGTPMLPM